MKTSSPDSECQFNRGKIFARLVVAMVTAYVLVWCPPVRATGPAQTFSFGVVPQQSAGELARLWTPLLNYLSEKTGYTLQLETAKDIATFEHRLSSGAYDFAYSNPLTYALRHHARGYEAFAKEQSRMVVGILVVRRDSPYKSVADLAGTELAFPAEAALGATLIPLAYLAKQGIAVTPHYVGSHDSVYLTVARGLYAAGGGVTRTFEMAPGTVREQTRILWTSPGYPSHPFVVRRGVPPEAASRVQAALIAAATDPAGQAALKQLAFAGVTAARDGDYDPLRALGLKLPDEPAQ